MAVNYPNNPTIGDEFTLPSGIVMVCEVGGSPARWKPKPEFKNYLFPVADVLSLKATEGEFDGQQASLASYYLGLNKGGGVFVWDADNTNTDDDGTVIAVTGVATGRWVRLLDGFITPEMFGAVGNGSDESTVFQKFVTYCSVNKMKGVSSLPLNLNGATINLGSDTDIEFSGNCKLTRAALHADGSLDSEIGLTSPTLKGSNVINVPSHDYAAGDWLFIKSCINCLSPDAGDDQLGSITGNVSYFAEFVQVESVTATAVTITRPVIFDYTNTPGADSAGRTNSTVSKVNFVENIKLSGLWMQDKPDEYSPLKFEYCRNVNVKIKNIKYETRLDSQFLIFFRCLDSVASGNSSRPLNTGGGSDENHFLTQGSQNCGFVNVNCYGGGQCVDFTFNTAIERANPSLFCYVNDSRFNYAGEAFTSHPGCYQTKADNVHANNCDLGFRLRSKGDQLTNFSFTKTSQTGYGVFLEQGYSEGALVSNGVISGGLYGVQVTMNDPSSSTSSVAGRARVSNLTITKSGIGVAVVAQPANSVDRPIDISGITVIQPATSGVLVGSYNNGATVKDITVVGTLTGSARACVEYAANTKNLTIDGVTGINVGVVPVVRGASSLSFITDTTTFPSGNAEANLRIGRVAAPIGGVPFSAVVRDSTAFASGETSVDHSVKVGSSKVRQQVSVSADLAEWQNSGGTKLLGVNSTGKLSGTVSSSVKASINAAADLAALKTAILGLLE